MLIALTGLHAAGKSHFTHTIPEKFGFSVYNKKEVIVTICQNETGRKDWDVWYRDEFRKDPYLMTSKIISVIPKSENSILDSVHSYNEWQIIKQIREECFLSVVVTPKLIRSLRWEKDDKIKDLQRIKYWHSVYGEELGCLLAEADWSFNGAASQELNEKGFKELIGLLSRKRCISHQIPLKPLEQQRQREI